MGLVSRQLGCQQNDLGGIGPHVWQLGGVDQVDGVTGLIWLLHMGGLQVWEERTSPSTHVLHILCLPHLCLHPTGQSKSNGQLQGVEQQAVSHC